MGENPPAFPHVTQSKRAGSDTIYTHVSEGMTLRDWFAGQALCGFTSFSLDDGEPFMGAADTAKAAYNYADAMLAARKDQPHA